jgi:Bacterial regulatory proteins, tetR family.
MLEAAERVIIRRGYRAATMDEIAKEAESPKQLYTNISETKLKSFWLSFFNIWKKSEAQLWKFSYLTWTQL